MFYVRVWFLVLDFFVFVIFLLLSFFVFQFLLCFLVIFFGYVIDELNYVFVDDFCSGMDRFEVRMKFWEDLEKFGFVIKVELYILWVF